MEERLAVRLIRSSLCEKDSENLINHESLFHVTLRHHHYHYRLRLNQKELAESDNDDVTLKPLD